MKAVSLEILLGFALGCVLCGVVRTQEDQDVNSANTTTSDYKLVLVQAVWRHGNRTAVLPFPSTEEEYINKTYPFQFGQLTPDGRRAAQTLGEYFKNRYAGFFPPYFSYTAATTHCTAFRRSQETSMVAANGIWPPAGPQVWQPSGLGQLWTPIPCIYAPFLEDKTWLQFLHCPRLIQLIRATMKSPQFKAKLLEITNLGTLNKYVAFNEGLPSVTNVQLAFIYDNLLSGVSSGSRLPHWARLVYPQPLEQVYGSYVSAICNDPESMKLTVGEFWKTTMEMATNVSRGLSPKGRVFYGYSAHDINVACLMKSLNLIPIDEPLAPTFTAAFIIEWYQDQSNASLIGAKFFYRNDTLGNTVTLTIPGCTAICPLDTIREQLADLIPVQKRVEYCKPLKPLALAEHEAGLDIMRLWITPELVSDNRPFVDYSYLIGEQADLR